MAFRNQSSIAVGNENIEIMQRTNLKNNLLSRNRGKQPLGNLNNIIHLGRHNLKNGEIENNKKEILKPKNISTETNNIFIDELDDFCRYKRNEKSFEAKWLEEEFANIKIFDKIIQADKPRTKPISKKELDWIQYYEFGDNVPNIDDDLEFKEIDESPFEDFPTIPCMSFEHNQPPLPTNNLFDDLNFLEIGDISQKDVTSNIFDLPAPVIESDFSDMNFLNDSLNTD